MLRRLLALVLVIFALGFVVFAVTLPRPAGDVRADALVVLTGEKGRIPRALAILQKRQAPVMLVSGVDPEVKPGEFQAEFGISPALMACCITLGFESVDTRSNAREVADYVARHHVRRFRLVTSDWHMRRAAWEVRQAIAPDVEIIEDAVATRASLNILFVEYCKLVARRIWDLGSGRMGLAV